MMRVMMMAGAASLLGGGAYLGGAFDGGEYYPMAPADVEARLAGLNFGPELGNSNSGSGKMSLALRSRGPALLRWDLMVGGRKAGEVRANLSPEEPGTRVSVDFQFTDKEATMGLQSDPFLNEVAQIAMEEKVDSTLDGRAFNAEIVKGKMAAAIAANPQAVGNMQKTLNQNISKQLDEIESGGGYGSRNGSGQKNSDWRETHSDGGWGKN